MLAFVIIVPIALISAAIIACASLALLAACVLASAILLALVLIFGPVIVIVYGADRRNYGGGQKQRVTLGEQLSVFVKSPTMWGLERIGDMWAVWGDAVFPD